MKIGDRVEIIKVEGLLLPQYDFLIGKMGIVEGIDDSNLNSTSVKLDGYASAISFNERELKKLV